jgi:glycosyltransferase involved in cell wall biosynthesis
MDTAPLHAAAPPSVRFVERFVSEGEAAALFRRADLAVLPYREIEQSGVLYTALGFGVPLVLSDVGGFPDIAAAGAAQLVAPGDPAELHDALAGLVADPSRLATLAMAALRLADESQGWDAIARAHLALYDSLLR